MNILVASHDDTLIPFYPNLTEETYWDIAVKFKMIIECCKNLLLISDYRFSVDTTSISDRRISWKFRRKYQRWHYKGRWRLWTLARSVMGLCDAVVFCIAFWWYETYSLSRPVAFHALIELFLMSRHLTSPILMILWEEEGFWDISFWFFTDQLICMLSPLSKFSKWILTPCRSISCLSGAIEVCRQSYVAMKQGISITCQAKPAFIFELN